MILRLLSMVFGLSLMLGCASEPTSSVNPDFNFTQVKTFSLFPRESRFSDIQSLSDYERNRIELAIEQKMEESGFDYKPLEDADVVISYFLVGRSLRELQTYNKLVRACLGCAQAEQQRLNQDIRSSMLVIDVLDSVKRRSVFRGFVKVDLDIENSSDENQQEIIAAVDQILGQLPSNTVQ
ncbi:MULTISPECIES: DUF4136 domain-containing protein [unclassified Thalassotalea]|uniref:DUF4136 domain-containing protein n=1 Tax=unclassified Thalassotalea TaxID=2614972 RepID=UPI0010811484|nr:MULTISPECIES: DUF4136 domain-containing protein [unclassified Thalassotalea]NMP15908.1 DUF4136 domain-containing protein [Thalassotalea sp. Y01]QBY04937.1 DUF4136 domain-containing protein [Thalassotalea sp. HSM 43]